MEKSSLQNTIRVLLVDDDEEDYIILKHLFSSMREMTPRLDWVSSSDEAIAVIEKAEHDAYLIDYRIDARTGLDVLQAVNAHERVEPFMLLTGVGDKGIERESLQLAASDYLIKKNLTSESLARALYYALGRKEQEKQKIQRLLEISKTKDEFISIASHQLRTPATAVKQYVGMALDGMGGELTEPQQAFLQKAYDNNERQLLIINNLLRVAQIDAGGVELSQKMTDVTALVQKATEDFYPLFLEKSQTLTFADTAQHMAYIDESSIRMVVDNLLENASKYSDNGTPVTVTVAEKDDKVELRIADEGVGVSEPERLFKKFSRIDNRLSTEVGGTGIGLYWARSIARLHGGDLRYEPNRPNGSQFIVELPRSVK